MRYPLEHGCLNESLLFWLRRWIRYKVISLSSSNVTEEKQLDSILVRLDGEMSMTELSETVKTLRHIGMGGVNSYFVPARAFAEWALKRKFSKIQEFNSENLMEFLTIKTAKKSDATKKNYRNALNNFFVYISKYNQYPINSDTGYQFNIDIGKWQGLTGSSGEKAPAALTEEEIYKLFEVIDAEDFINKKSAFFYRLIIRLLFFTGTRISEALSIKKTDIISDSTMYTIRIKGKGNKERTVFLKRGLIELQMKRWEETSECENHAYLFCALRKPNELPNPSSVSHKIADLLKKAGIQSRKRGAHVFRHTYATIIYDKTQDLVLVQDLLGHKDPSTTRIYTHLSDKRKRESANMF